MADRAYAADGVAYAILDETGVGLADGADNGGDLAFIDAVRAAGNDHHGCIVGKPAKHDGLGDFGDMAAQAAGRLGRGAARGGQHHDLLVVSQFLQQAGHAACTFR